MEMVAMLLCRSSLTLCFVFLVLISSLVSTVTTLKLSTSDGQADIGAYHVQPGRCSGVEARMGRQNYGQFFRASPFHTSFTQILSPSADSPAPDVESMDATSLCAFNPTLTEGYGGGFDDMKLYLVYSRCIFGTEEMRVLCGATDAKGRPISEYNSLIQAACPAGTKCKNLCATMRDPSLTSKFAKKQVQLAQCMPDDQWQTLTDIYSPKSEPLFSAGDPDMPKVAPLPTGNMITEPTVVDKPPAKDPSKDPTHVDKDSTIPGMVVHPAAAAGGGNVKGGPSHLQISPLKRPSPADKPANKPAQPPQPAPKDNVVNLIDLQKLAPPQAANPHANNTDSKSPKVIQKPPTEMGFRKRTLPNRHRGRDAATERA